MLGTTGAHGRADRHRHGGTCTAADTSGCTGGTIQNTTGGDDASTTPAGTGIVLRNTQGASLTRMHVQNNSNYGVRGTTVAGFTMLNSVVNGTNGTSAAHRQQGRQRPLRGAHAAPSP